MRAANDYLVLKEAEAKFTDAQQRTMTVRTSADIQLEVVSIGDHADTSQFTVGNKVVADVGPTDYFYADGERFIAVHASSVKAILNA